MQAGKPRTSAAASSSLRTTATDTVRTTVSTPSESSGLSGAPQPLLPTHESLVGNASASASSAAPSLESSFFATGTGTGTGALSAHSTSGKGATVPVRRINEPGSIAGAAVAHIQARRFESEVGAASASTAYATSLLTLTLDVTALPPPSHPGAPLDAQLLELALDNWSADGTLFLGRFRMLGARERRQGGQGVVQFAVDDAPNAPVAIKFFLNRNAFRCEEELYLKDGLRDMTPAISLIENNDAVRSPHACTSCMMCVVPQTDLDVARSRMHADDALMRGGGAGGGGDTRGLALPPVHRGGKGRELGRVAAAHPTRLCHHRAGAFHGTHTRIDVYACHHRAAAFHGTRACIDVYACRHRAAAPPVL
jgi:hypothetical protein